MTLAWTTQEPSLGIVDLVGETGTLRWRGEELVRHHAARFSGLSPNAAYRYSVDGVHEGVVRTAREAELPRFAVFGHPGGSAFDGSYPYAALGHTLSGLDLDFALCTGDVCYYTTEASFRDLMIRPFAGLLSSRPIYLAAGNHDGGFPYRGQWDYTVMRRLFPYDYPSAKSPFHSFVRGNIHFLSLAYHPSDADDALAQIEWARKELADSRSEFRIAFMGAANRPKDGSFERLVQVLTEGGVDVIFGGDGKGTKQEDLGGVPFFFAGTEQLEPPPFYDVQARPYELLIVQREASMSRPTKSWTIPSKQPKRLVRDLMPLARPHPGNPKAVVLDGIGIPSTEFHGVRLTISNPIDRKLVVLLRWGPKLPSLKGGAERMFREQVVFLPASETLTYDVALPPRDPLSGEGWTLHEMDLRIDGGGLAEGLLSSSAPQPDVTVRGSRCEGRGSGAALRESKNCSIERGIRICGCVRNIISKGEQQDRRSLLTL